MSINIKYFTVSNTTTGHITPTGNKNINWNKSQSSILSNLVNLTPVSGTPESITRDGLNTTAHMGTTYINIITEHKTTNSFESLFISDMIRITIIGGYAAYNNSIIYGFSANNTTTATNITWSVAFANMNAQNTGDYIDIPLPDKTYYPNLFLAIALIPNGWNNRTIVDADKKICSLPSNSTYYNINKTYSSTDTDYSHSINSQGYNSTYGIFTRIILAFEDWEMLDTDRDYDDVVISVSCSHFDDIYCNDSSFQ